MELMQTQSQQLNYQQLQGVALLLIYGAFCAIQFTI